MVIIGEKFEIMF